jgi:SnoaL-like domain
MTLRRGVLVGAVTGFLAACSRARFAQADEPKGTSEGGAKHAAYLERELRRLSAQVEQLSIQTQIAEGYIAVGNLQCTYGYYVDKARWDDVADLFARDATLEINGRGVYIGQDRVRQYMHKLGSPGHGKLFNHLQLQPVIHVAPDARSAKARWRAVIQLGELGKTARWGEGTYENTYAKEDNVWKIKSLHFYQTYDIDYYAGWDKGALPLMSQFTDFPPDRPPSEDYKVFPDFYVPAFHYKNPVSGR